MHVGTAQDRAPQATGTGARRPSSRHAVEHHGTSIHANSARQALVKMCTLPLLAGDNIGSRFVVPTVASSVDIVVHTGLDADGTRAVREIVAVTGRVENGLIESEPVFVRQGGRLERGHGMPLRREAFEQAGIDLDEALGMGRWAP